MTIDVQVEDRFAMSQRERDVRKIMQGVVEVTECGNDELWRGLLDLALAEFRHIGTLIAQMETKLDALAKTDANVQRLETIPGVGPRTAEAIVAQLHDPQRFDSGKQVSADAGLVPRQYQSGETDHRGRISKRGPALLRKMLVQCADPTDGMTVRLAASSRFRKDGAESAGGNPSNPRKC